MRASVVSLPRLVGAGYAVRRGNRIERADTLIVLSRAEVVYAADSKVAPHEAMRIICVGG